MNHYLFIESRDPFESRDTRFVEETATALQQRGHQVTVFLVQNGVLASRQNARDGSLARDHARRPRSVHCQSRGTNRCMRCQFEGRLAGRGARWSFACSSCSGADRFVVEVALALDRRRDPAGNRRRYDLVFRGPKSSAG